jgi:hypothetical protein
MKYRKNMQDLPACSLYLRFCALIIYVGRKYVAW